MSVLSQDKFSIEPEKERFPPELFRAESKAREERSAKDRIRLARFPSFKSFEDFDTDFRKGIAAKEPEILSESEWLDALFNLILIDSPGTGKTHIALAVGGKAVRESYRVAFQTMDSLIHRLKTREISVESINRLNYVKKRGLLIVDEFGYLPVSRTGANFFFALISELYEKPPSSSPRTKALGDGRKSSATRRWRLRYSTG